MRMKDVSKTFHIYMDVSNCTTKSSVIETDIRNVDCSKISVKDGHNASHESSYRSIRAP
jgi:hypothetical protein